MDRREVKSCSWGSRNNGSRATGSPHFEFELTAQWATRTPHKMGQKASTDLGQLGLCLNYFRAKDNPFFGSSQPPGSDIDFRRQNISRLSHFENPTTFATLSPVYFDYHFRGGGESFLISPASLKSCRKFRLEKFWTRMRPRTRPTMMMIHQGQGLLDLLFMAYIPF
uniref:HDC08157 n=1 Tax=Drosophila melanogaster TaxID=7227 RepID=Q6ILX4_DROME|nr:TPA_inf: HDC08157 [Drosophila melanogaster]